MACDWFVSINLNTARNLINSTESRYLVMLSLFTWLSTCCSKAALGITWLCHCSTSQESPWILCGLSYSLFFFSFHGHMCRKASFNWGFLCPYNAVHLDVWVRGTPTAVLHVSTLLSMSLSSWFWATSPRIFSMLKSSLKLSCFKWRRKSFWCSKHDPPVLL